MNSQIFSEVEDFEVQSGYEKALEAVMLELSDESKVDFESITVIVMADTDHTELNNKYLGHDYSTDILTFDLSESDAIEGEIYINAMVCENNAKEYGVSTANEFHRLMIHGLLHLVGYDDHSEEDQREMRAQEERYLQRLTDQGFM